MIGLATAAAFFVGLPAVLGQWDNVALAAGGFGCLFWLAWRRGRSGG